jgi:hypothetical protein
MLRIEKLFDPMSTVLKLSGWIQEEHLPLLDAEILACEGMPTLDLTDVKLVDRTSVRSLIRWESGGIRLLNCPLYIREWMSRERARNSPKGIE